MAMLRRALVSVVLLCLVGSCDGVGAEIPPQEQAALEAEAKGLPLESRYALHEKVFAQHKPPYRFLAPIVAEAGPRAYALAVSRGSNGNLEATAAALAVIQQYTMGTSPAAHQATFS